VCVCVVYWFLKLARRVYIYYYYYLSVDGVVCLFSHVTRGYLCVWSPTFVFVVLDLRYVLENVYNMLCACRKFVALVYVYVCALLERVMYLCVCVIYMYVCQCCDTYIYNCDIGVVSDICSWEV